MSRPRRVSLVPAYVLHHRNYRDHSLLIELLSAEHGRVGLVARGARNQRGDRRALLQPFRPLFVTWSKRGELGTLTDVEAAGPGHALRGGRLFCGFYMNELLVRLLYRDDPHPSAFDAYALALGDLSAGADESKTLRLFEKRILDALGYGVELDRVTLTGEPVDTDARYLVDLETGVIATGADGSDAPPRRTRSWSAPSPSF